MSKTSRSTARTLQRADVSGLAAAGRGRHSRAPGFSDRLSTFLQMQSIIARSRFGPGAMATGSYAGRSAPPASVLAFATSGNYFFQQIIPSETHTRETNWETLMSRIASTEKETDNDALVKFFKQHRRVCPSNSRSNTSTKNVTRCRVC